MGGVTPSGSSVAEDERAAESGEAPSGLPPEEPEETPLGVPAEADQEPDDGSGPDAMPGIPTEGDPPTAG
jgi:hypothetical protein